MLGEAVIPGSLKKFDYKDKDGYVIYRLSVLNMPSKVIVEEEQDLDPKEKMARKIKNRTPLETVIANVKELKGTVREFKFNPEES